MPRLVSYCAILTVTQWETRRCARSSDLAVEEYLKKTMQKWIFPKSKTSFMVVEAQAGNRYNFHVHEYHIKICGLLHNFDSCRWSWTEAHFRSNPPPQALANPQEPLRFHAVEKSPEPGSALEKLRMIITSDTTTQRGQLQTTGECWLYFLFLEVAGLGGH